MDAFIRKNSKLILSTLYMVAGLLALGYSILYSRLDAYTSDIQAVNQKISVENRVIQDQLKKDQEAAANAQGKEDKNEGRISSLPDFLLHINTLAKNNNVIIRKLVPDQEDQDGGNSQALAISNPLKFRLEIITDFFTFLKFSLDLESLDTILDDLEVHRYDMTNPEKPLHFITFTLIPRNDAKPLKNKRLDELRAVIYNQGHRNPFRRLVVLKGKPTTDIDLTYLYRLTGIGTNPDGRRYATIDRKNYTENMKLGGRLIKEIQMDRVLLIKRATQPGVPDKKFILRFRKRKMNTIK
ncbi:hypothetical protein ACQZV8_00025 [Magnetococcales bacterium HHB-1]